MASLVPRGGLDPYVVQAYGDDYVDLVDALYEAIPQEEEDRLVKVHRGTKINGGTSRGWSNRVSAVCTYNNTIKDREEIVAWYRRARELAGQEGKRGEEVQPA